MGISSDHRAQGAQLIAASQLGTSAEVTHTITSPELAYMLEALAEPFLRSQQFVQVLEDWSPAIGGLILYLGRRQVPATLRAVIAMIPTSSSAPSRRSLEPILLWAREPWLSPPLGSPHKVASPPSVS
jgi:hypothetical protein